jgi:hemerythrin-like domain-containing protein
MSITMDAITLLRDDHKKIEQLFKRFEKAGDRAHVRKRQLVDQMIEELSIHAAIEEQLFYPVARATVRDSEDITLESLEEHRVVKWLLSELDGMDPENERFDAKVKVLIDNVRHHVEEEETNFFKKVRADLSRSALADLGDELNEARKMAPTRPRPNMPDVPPANVVVGAVAGAMDRVGDNISGVAQGSVTAVQDLIARILGNKEPKVSPRGSSTTRKRAREVRRTASTATEGVEDTARTAQKGAKKTARAASAGAKGTATSAKKGARNTQTTAKRASTTTGRTAKKAAQSTTRTAKRSAKKTAAASSSR